MKPLSVWHVGTAIDGFPSLQRDAETDIVIVGGGITGVTLASLLADAGQRTILIESFSIGDGTTGHSTGNLYSIVGPLQQLHRTWGAEVTRGVLESRDEAVNLVEHIAGRLPVDCLFRRVPHHLYAVDASGEEGVRAEFELLRSLGIPCALRTDLSIGVSTSPVLRIEGQAQFHPLVYVRALAHRVASAECRFYEYTPALQIEHDARRVRTPHGTIAAREIVLATHTPKGLFARHAEMTVHREYAVAGALPSGAPPEAISWGRGAAGHSVRRAAVNGRDWLVMIGTEVKTGRHDGLAELRTIAARAEELFGLVPAVRWSAQNYHSPDFIPFIGRSIGVETMIATGFAADGLTYGTLAARLLADQLTGHDNAFSELYSARRLAPAKSAPRVVEENMLVLKSFAEDYVTRRHAGSLAELQPGSGDIVEYAGERVAAYRRTDGSMTMVSPVCTHLKCLVHWNAAEASWDCPCHGSRFGVDGRVLEGPALSPLSRVEGAEDSSRDEIY